MSLKKYIILREYHNGDYHLTLGEYEGKLCLCDWTNSVKYDAGLRKLCRLIRCRTRFENEEDKTSVLDMAAVQLDEYFAGTRKNFNVPLHIVGSEFHLKAMEIIQTIKYGEQVSYGDFSNMINGGKSMSQCIGSCIGSNLLSIFIPSHRIVAKLFHNGGYRGGLSVKKALLKLEEEN